MKELDIQAYNDSSPSPSPSHEVIANKRKYWQNLIDEWMDSDLTQKAFCAERGIGISSFYSWKSRLSNKDRKPLSKPFIPIEIQKQATSTSLMRILLKTGVRIDLPINTSVDKLSSIFRLLGVLE